MLYARGLTPRQVYSSLGIGIVAFITLHYPTNPHDFWWHLAWGRTISSHGPLYAPVETGFVRPGTTFFDQPWLAQLLMFSLFRAGGRDLMLVVQGIVVGTTFGLLLDLMTRRAGNRARLGVMVLLVGVVPLTYYNWELRPQTYCLLLFVLVLRRLTSYRTRAAATAWPLVPMMVVWANLHGTFVLGIGLIGVVVFVEGVRCFRNRVEDAASDTLTRKEWRSLAAWSALAVAGTSLNPHGVRVFEYALLQPRLTAWDIRTDWLSPSPRTLVGALFAAGMIALFVLLALAKKRASATDLTMLVVFLWPALMATRSIVWFALVAGPIAAEALASLVPGDAAADDVPSPGGYLFVGVLALAALAEFFFVQRDPATYRPYTSDTPIAAVKSLRQLDPSLRPRRLFHSGGTGSYLLFAAPEQPVFIDPRFELYSVDQWRDLQRMEAGIDVAKLTAKYDFDGLLVTLPAQQALLDEVVTSPVWRPVFRDSTSGLFLRQPAPSAR